MAQGTVEIYRSQVLLEILAAEVHRCIPDQLSLSCIIPQGDQGSDLNLERERDLLQVPHFFVGTLQPL